MDACTLELMKKRLFVVIWQNDWFTRNTLFFHEPFAQVD
jgi:hypothetical protein